MNNENIGKLSFEITSSSDFLRKLEQEYIDFDKNHVNPRHAINCAITSWHLTDWTYHEFFSKEYLDEEKFDIKRNRIITVKGLQLYQQELIKKCPNLNYMKQIANGSKHCVINDKSFNMKTNLSHGDFSPFDFSRKDFNVPRFEIHINQNKSLDFEETFLKTLEFWRNFIIDCYSNE